MRTLESHKVNPANESVEIKVMDEASHGGAHHLYHCHCTGTKCHGKKVDTGFVFAIQFQNGPIVECGTNGLTHEILLAIVIDRLQCFQKGEYACRENAIALTKLEEAMHWLQHRTRQRMARGVEGTHTK